MIDTEGFRANVGIVICNRNGQVLWARRYGQHSWQFPQGGIDEGESAEQAMFRELHEEVGLNPNQVKILRVTKNWIRYRLPKRLIRQDSNPVCIGQKQKWFLLQLTCNDDGVDLMASGHPEFDDWRWVSFWYPVRNVVSFKRDVYRKVMKDFIASVMTLNKQSFEHKRNKKRRRRQS